MIGGHGWVTPRPDGAHARCGGPAICPACALEAGRLSERQDIRKADPALTFLSYLRKLDMAGME